MPRMLLTLLLLALVPVACQQAPSGPPAGPKSPDTRPAGEHANPKFNSVHDMMKAKLAHAQAVLEGVVINDLDAVEMNANQIIRLSELAAWQVHRTMEYNLYSDELRWNARELARHAREKKLHAAMLDYVSMTTTCVKCHDYMKQAGLVRDDVPYAPLTLGPVR